MIKNKFNLNKLIIVSFFIAQIIFSSLVLIFPKSTALAADDATTPLQFTPQVSIPGSDFNAATPINAGKYDDATGKMSSDLLAKYIIAFYNYGLAISGVLATIVLMGAGVIWLTSGGDSGKITQAKELISGAVTGVIILVCAWLILTTVNPYLVELNNLDTLVVRKEANTKNCSSRGTKKTCEELVYCEWNNNNICADKKGQCSKNKALFGSEKTLCCCELGGDGNYENCNWASYLGGIGIRPDNYPCASCGTTFTNVTDSAEGIGLCTRAQAQAENPIDYAKDYCRGSWCYSDAAMSKYYYCNPANKKNGDDCPHDGYCYDKICWTSDQRGNNEGEIGEPCGNETPTGKCYKDCPNGYKHEWAGGRNCNNSKCCILDSQ